MRIAKVFAAIAFVLALFIVSLETSAQDKKADEPKIVLPKDAKAVVISYDPGAGGFVRKGEAPYLKIQADGSVTVTDLHNGAKKETMLTVKELDDLVRFILHDKKFFDVTEKKMKDAIEAAAGQGPFIAVTGAGISKIIVEANGKKHEVSFRAARAYTSAYPKVEVVPQFVAIEKRLLEYANAVAKGK